MTISFEMGLEDWIERRAWIIKRVAKRAAVAGVILFILSAMIERMIFGHNAHIRDLFAFSLFPVLLLPFIYFTCLIPGEEAAEKKEWIGPHTLITDAGGIQISKQMIPWNKIQSIKRGEKHFFVQTKRGHTCFIVPFSAFPSLAEREQFIALLQEKISRKSV